MKKNSTSHSAFFNPRIFAAFVLCSAGAWLAMFSFASTPASETLTDTSGPKTYTAGPFNVPNQTPAGAGQLDVGPECGALGAPGGMQAQPCDDNALTVTLPAGYHAAHPNATIKVTMSWTDAGAGKSDYDLYIYKTPRADCNPTDCTATDGTQAADYQSATSNNPEVAAIAPLVDGTQTYTLVIVPFTPTGETVTVKIELLPGSSGGGSCTSTGAFGGPDPTTPGVPRYQNFYAPDGTSAQAGSGEFNIGFDPLTHRIMTMNTGPIWRLTPGEVQVPAKPECCEALWEDKSNPTTNTGLDPILWTDQKTGRTFVSNSTAGANAVYGYTDAMAPFNDGDQWVPFAPSPPNFSDDHETIGSGPYPPVAGMPNPLATAANKGEAVYYCGQTFPVGSAECQRSDTLGASFGSGVPVYNGNTSMCGGLHGHVHVAPDGTVWLPVNQCGGKQGGAFSTDSGVTWTEFTIPNTLSQANGADPSIAIDANSDIYYAYVNNEPVGSNPLEGHARAVKGHRNADNSITWSNYFDLGCSHGVVNAAEIEAVGGDAGRAAVGFLGTNVAGDYQAMNFAGNWYVFIATTYDGGQTWATVNATPNDPVQSRTGIWQQGGSATDRNLLDFNEITVDDHGRVLYGYSDGCTFEGCIGGIAGNDYTAYMRVARQFGGKPLCCVSDPVEPALPKPPCLSGTRDANGSYLTWKAPDNGGADIAGYVILRGTTAGGETVLVANTGNIKTTYNDATADPAVPDYFYVVKAINAQGIGVQSNEIDLQVTVPPPPATTCELPGLRILVDPPNDELDMVPGHDVQSLSIAEPFALASNKIVFTLKMQSLSTVPPNTEWPITFNVGSTNYTVWMTNMPADGATTAPIFQVGPTGGTLVAADAASKFTPDGTITIVVPRSAIGNPAVGTQLTGFLTRITTGAPGGVTPDNMPDSLFPDGSYTIVSNAVCVAPQLTNVVSRKVHGSVGKFDLDLPVTGTAGIECRLAGASNGHKLVLTFDNTVTAVGTTTVAQGTATVAGTSLGPNLNQVTVNLTDVTNVQHLVLNLNGVQGSYGAVPSAIPVRMDVLLGDVTANGVVTNTDVSVVKGQVNPTKPITLANFREDVSVNGFVTNTDVSLVKGQVNPTGGLH